VAISETAFVHDLNPFLIRFGDSFGIRWYGLSYLAGFATAYFIFRWAASSGRIGLSLQKAGDLVFVLALGTIIGGRLGYCIFYDPQLLVRFSGQFPFWGLLEIHHGGMASHGGIIGIITACIIFARRNGLSALSTMDLAALASPPGIFFGRLANFINGELVGRAAPSNLPWAVKFPQDILLWPYQEPARLASLSPIVVRLGVPEEVWTKAIQSDPAGRLVEPILGRIVTAVQSGNYQIRDLLAPLLTARHPSQLYEALLEGLVLFLIMLVLWWKPKNPGAIAASFIVCYALLRTFVERFRMPDANIGFQLLGLTRGQWLSIGMLGLGAIFLYVCQCRSAKVD
jgi:phosphatidylglycerol---prolipoprotein diacylglyceryl transferase